ncbi:MAG: hypothetical protein A2341_16460 [Deltaproteobacteria bacterium RIFOXYB12_FULL_58_9]|nr:MAG: hypothetical protein A2341_16460 [Deltaproteobacteria bacterium RIFOXYB12_FULL_58_9]
MPNFENHDNDRSAIHAIEHAEDADSDPKNVIVAGEFSAAAGVGVLGQLLNSAEDAHLVLLV